MKRTILCMVMSLMTIAGFAQTNIYARMYGIIGGQVKSIIVETSGEVSNFDREGKLISCRLGENELKYSWKGNKVTVSAYQNGNKLGEEYITVTKNTAEEVCLTFSGGTLTETYRSNGGEDKSIISSNGMSMVETCYYRSDSDTYPYKCTFSFQGETKTMEMSNYQYDAKGNWVRQTTTVDGNSQTDIRTITYWD